MRRRRAYDHRVSSHPLFRAARTSALDMTCGRTVASSITAYTAARPLRAILLVAQFDDLGWEIPFTAALRAQSLVWGGTSNLPVPAVANVAAHPVYRAIVGMLDPDAIVWHDLVFADLQDLASERFDRQETELRAGLEGRGYGEAAVDRAVEGALTQPIAPGQFDAAAGAPFLKRQAYLHHDGRVEHARTRVGSGIGYPFVDALQIARPHRPDGISERHTTLSLPGQLALAAERGQITPWDRTRVAQAHVTQSDRAAVDDGWELARLLFGGASPQVAPTPFALSEAGLRWYSRPSEYDPRIAIVVGDDPWDFSWFYALRRMRGNAFWVPDCYASDLAWVTELRMLPLRLQLGASAVFSVTSVSGSEHVATVAAHMRHRRREVRTRVAVDRQSGRGTKTVLHQ